MGWGIRLMLLPRLIERLEIIGRPGSGNFPVLAVGFGEVSYLRDLAFPIG